MQAATDVRRTWHIAAHVLSCSNSDKDTVVMPVSSKTYRTDNIHGYSVLQHVNCCMCLSHVLLAVLQCVEEIFSMSAPLGVSVTTPGPCTSCPKLSKHIRYSHMTRTWQLTSCIEHGRYSISSLFPMLFMLFILFCRTYTSCSKLTLTGELQKGF